MERNEAQGYLRHLYRIMRRDAITWGRDSIVWGALMVALPPVAAYIKDPTHQIDWVMVKTALWLYLAVFGAYLLVHLIRAVKKRDLERSDEIRDLAAQLSDRQARFSSDDWKLLAKEFDVLPRRISVSYVYRTSDGHGESEWRQISSKLCTELCVRGGLMLLNSSHLKDELCRKTTKETDPRRLWLQCLDEAGALQYRGDPLRIPLGDGKFGDHLNGSISDVAEHSAVLCHTCSNLQFRQESLDNG